MNRKRCGSSSTTSDGEVTLGPLAISVPAGRRRVHRPTSGTTAAPRSVTRYPTVEEAVAAHAKLIARFGGSGGIQVRAALESALALRRSGYSRRVTAFVDGNKRVAVTMTAAFLLVNGYRLEFDDADTFSFLKGLYETGRVRFEELDRWLRQHIVAANPSA